MSEFDDLLTRGVANIIPSKEALEKLLSSGRKLNIYLGIEPTAPHIHLGHAVAIRKLQKLVDLDHHVTFLIGDFTALIGDTSDKESERPILTTAQVIENFKTYQAQAQKLLDFSKVDLKYNSEWIKKLNFEDILKLTRHFSLNDFISRELIKKRLNDGKSVSLPETLYPIMQGYDSYYLDTDLQIGGTDQTFNMQAGRTLQKDIRSKESFVLTLGFLEGTDGRKMSKSWGNAIWLDDEPNDMFGKVMSLKDELVGQYLLLATNLSPAEIEKLTSNNSHPMDLKKALAWQIVSELHSKQAAEDAKKHFESLHQKGELPSSIPEFKVTSSHIVDVLVETKLASSKSEARRLIDQGGVTLNNTKVTDPNTQIFSESVLQVGNRKFAKIKA